MPLSGAPPSSTWNVSSSLYKWQIAIHLTQLRCRFHYNAGTLGPRRGWRPLPVVPQSLPPVYLEFFISLFYLLYLPPHGCPETPWTSDQPVLLILDPPLTNTLSQHIVLAQKKFVQVDKWTFDSATHKIAIESSTVHLEPVASYDLFILHQALPGCPLASQPHSTDVSHSQQHPPESLFSPPSARSAGGSLFSQMILPIIPSGDLK